jgi:hypothetical protein
LGGRKIAYQDYAGNRAQASVTVTASKRRDN